MSPIYFDAAASRKPLEAVLKRFNDVSVEYYANPSALHIAGARAEGVLRSSSVTISRYLRVDPGEIYFTSGGTESNNLALFGMAKLRPRTHRHIVTLLSEHPSVTEVLKKLETEGFEVTWLRGIPSVNEILGALRPDTALVCVAHVNNETGNIYDIDSIGKEIKARSEACFYSDGVQGFGKIPLSLKYVDGYSFSGHKIGCVKGIGGLYLSRTRPIAPQILGGAQQNNIRSGTENTASAAALALACETAFDCMEENYRIVTAVRDELLNITGLIKDVHINGICTGVSQDMTVIIPDSASPYILNMSFLGVRSEVLLHSLAEAGLLASAGSACSAGKKGAKKNALTAMGYDKAVYESALRFSFSPENTVDEAKRALSLICEKVSFLRKYMRQ